MLSDSMNVINNIWFYFRDLVVFLCINYGLYLDIDLTFLCKELSNNSQNVACQLSNTLRYQLLNGNAKYQKSGITVKSRYQVFDEYSAKRLSVLKMVNIKCQNKKWRVLKWWCQCWTIGRQRVRLRNQARDQIKSVNQEPEHAKGGRQRHLMLVQSPVFWTGRVYISSGRVGGVCRAGSMITVHSGLVHGQHCCPRQAIL